MKNYHTILLTLLLSFCLNFAFAQDNIPEPLKPLSVLLGEWSGEGYSSEGPDKRVDFNQTEHVTAELDGQIFVFRGTGTVKGASEPSFRAYGVMTYDAQADQVYLHAWTMDGRYTRADVETGDGSFRWTFDVPNGGIVRYTAHFDEGHWSEQGEYSPDKGTNWYPFMEMNLTR